MKCFRLPTIPTGIPGYSEERRRLLVGAPAVLAAVLASPRRLLAVLESPEPDRSLELFISGTARRAAALKSDTSAGGQDAYVSYLADAVAAVTHVPKEDLGTRSWKDLDPGVFLGVSGRNAAFFVVHWRLEPGAFLPAHCHPKTSVCTLGLEGLSTVRHFEVPPTAPSYRDDGESEFPIRETRRIELRAGTVSTLTEHRDNVHLFEASEQGARGIDVTTDYGGDGSFSFLAFDREDPVDREAGVYLARWIGTSL